jgi:hypothetical protein
LIGKEKNGGKTLSKTHFSGTFKNSKNSPGEIHQIYPRLFPHSGKKSNLCHLPGIFRLP